MLELGGGAEEEGGRAQWAATFQNPGVTTPHPAPWQAQPPSSQNPSSRSGPRPLKRRGGLEKVRLTSPIRLYRMPKVSAPASGGFADFHSCGYTSLLSIRTALGSAQRDFGQSRPLVGGRSAYCSLKCRV